MNSALRRIEKVLRLSVTPTMIVLGLLLSVPQAHAAVKYWIGTTPTAGVAPSDRFELPGNWSTTSRGIPDTTAPVSGDIAVFNYSGTTVRIRSHVNLGGAGGLVMTNSWTGSILQGTGTLRIGTAGWRMGSGTFVGGYGSATASGMINIAGTAGFTQTGGIVRNIIKNFNNSGSLSIMSVNGTRPSFTATGTLIFSGAASQTFTIGKNRVTAVIRDLTINNSGSAGSNKLYSSGSGMSLSGSLTITAGALDLTKTSTAQPLIVKGGATVTDTLLSGNNITLSGALTIGSSATMTVTGGTLTFSSDNPQTVTVSNSNQRFNHIVINNTAATNARNTVTFATNPFTVLGNVTVTQGSWDASTNGIAASVVGNISVADLAVSRFLTAANLTTSGSITVKPLGTFTQTAGITNLNGTSQTLSGSMTIYNLQKSISSADTLSFYPGYTYTIHDITRVGGSSSLKLTVQSSISGRRWTITPGSRQTVVYITVQDSLNSAETTASITCLDCTDNGNNQGWGFTTTPTTTTPTTTSSGGGGGGGGTRRTVATATATTSTNTATESSGTQKAATPESNASISNHAKILQKRADTIKARINSTKNLTLKKSLERGLARLQKMISKLK